MRVRVGWALALLLASVSAVRADDREEALAVVDQAIKAHGGQDALAKARSVERESSGQMFVAGKAVPFTDTFTARFPDQLRLDLKASEGGQKLQVLVVVNGDKGWQSTGGAAAELAAERVKELREDGFAYWLTTLVPLKKDDALTLAPLAEAKVNGKPARGVKVSRKGAGDVKLYFDKESHLLVKMERQAAEAGLSVAKEEVYSAHKEFDGVKLPTKIVQSLGGNKFIEITEAKYKFPKLSDATFAKP